RQVIVSAPVYSDPRLLKTGVTDGRVEGGRLRPGGFVNDDLYTDRFAAASARTGITDWLTAEIHVEGTDSLSSASVGVALRAGQLGMLEFGASRSRADAIANDGEARLAGYTYRGDYLHVGFREIRRDPDHVSLGYPEPGNAPVRERVASIGVSGGPANLTLSGLERIYADRAQKLGNAALAIRLGSLGQLLLTATRDLSTPDAEPVYGAHLSIPLGRRSHVYHSVSGEEENARTSSGYNFSAPPGSGFGARVNRETFQDDERYFAEAILRGALAEAAVSAQSDTTDDTSWSGRLGGAVIATGHHIGLSRDDGNSFAIVRTAGADNVRVLREHQLATRTGSNGVAIVPGLRPYQVNRVALNVEDMPMAGEVDVSELAVVAGRRGVVMADYGYRQQRKLLARLKTPQWSSLAIPAGAEVSVEGTPDGLVGFDGTIYVTLPQNARVRLDARWPGGNCTATVTVPSGEGVYEAGDLTCEPR
ncbi:MAG: fimbria/pilus outer membrane usher protein, partial [Proteobacteria bacterium]|nr:fimbria/pilus outer membrane usher protein [Pseudomonadota bacterium]